jgi:DNA polymerase-3 subunit alpha
VRKAIGKKKRDIMQAEEPKFIKGCVQKGLTEAQAHHLWALIQPFADYSFNKAHATCYAQIAYWTAYLKANYPSAFMAALMTSDFDDTDRLAIEITECKHMGITVLPPDVNESYMEFAVVPDTPQIRFGMWAIKNVGAGAVEEILRARHEESFASLEDYLTRVNCRIVNRKALESLVKAGAFDRFGDRQTLLHNLDLLLAFAARVQKQANSGQTDIFGSAVEEVEAHKSKLELMAPSVASDAREQLLWERELLGLYLSQHPLELFETILSEKTVPLNSLTVDHDRKQVTVGGAITDVREITTRNGQKMAFVKIEDQFGEVEVILFPGSYQQTIGLWERDRVVLIKGKVNSRDKDGNAGEEVKIMVDDAREITTEQASAYQATGKKTKTPKAGKSTASAAAPKPASQTEQVPPRVYIRLKSTSDEQTLLTLKETIDANHGDTEVVLVLGEAAARQAIRLPGGIDSSSDGLDRLRELVGPENLALK